MKLASLLLLGGLLVAVLPVRADDDSNLVSRSGLFSYQAPDGWTIRDSPVWKYKISFEKITGGFSPNIHVVVEHYPGPLGVFVARLKGAITNSPLYLNAQIADESTFDTNDNLEGTRLLVKDTVSKLDLQQIFYVFAGDGDRKYIVTGSCLAPDGDKYAPTFDDAMKTFEALSDTDQQ